MLPGKKGVSLVRKNNVNDPRASLPSEILQFLNADIGDKLVWKKAQDFLAREITLIDVIAPDGKVKKKLSLKQLDEKEY